MKEICFVSRNENKVKEVSETLKDRKIRIVRKNLELEEIQDKDVAKVAKSKAEDAFALLERPVLVEDTGLYIEAMNGYPGSMIKHFFESIGLQGIVDFLRGKGRKATAVTAFAYCDSAGRIRVFEGRIEGSISDKLRGKTDFNWDKIFIPRGREETYAEMGLPEKVKISQRTKALEAFHEWFDGRDV